MRTELRVGFTLRGQRALPSTPSFASRPPAKQTVTANGFDSIIGAGFVLMPTIGAPSSGLAATRKALVIGNATYPNSMLRGAAADAALMRQLIERSGFQVVYRKDLGAASMRKATLSFASAIGRGDDVVIYYSGHGFEIKGENYLIPVDFNANEEHFAAESAINLGVSESLSSRAFRLASCRALDFH